MKKSLKIFLVSFAVIIILALVFHLYFIRDPEIAISQNSQDIVSPASGKVIKIMQFNQSQSELTIEKGLFGKIKTLTQDTCDKCYVVSIFMNPLSIHVQRASLSGKVINVTHKDGTLLPTTTFENGLINEKLETLVENEAIGKYKIIQIAGFVVRRIVTYIEPNQVLEKGERIGFIRYGSQVSIILPSDKVNLVVREGDKVEVGSSIIAKIK